METWKPVVGHEGVYEVSCRGRVRSLRRWTTRRDGQRQGYAGRMLRPGIASNGYPTVALGRGNTRTVHSLVAEAFLGPCPEGHEVHHRNHDRTDPRAANLEYVTRSENIRASVENGSWESPRRAASRRSPARLAALARARAQRWS